MRRFLTLWPNCWVSSLVMWCKLYYSDKSMLGAILRRYHLNYKRLVRIVMQWPRHSTPVCSPGWSIISTHVPTPDKTPLGSSEYWTYSGSRTSPSTLLNSCASTIPMRSCTNSSITMCLL
uniref:Uncharacterized protein n=1 Tax=Cacopsylla melanoneura TaxID=428564 RepID=A0A8D9DYE9_9HEMI